MSSRLRSGRRRTSGERIRCNNAASSASEINPASSVAITLSLSRPAREGREPSKFPCQLGNNYKLRVSQQPNGAHIAELTERMSSSCPLLVTVTPLALLPFPKTEFCALRSAAFATSSLLTSTNACESVFPLRSRSTCTRSTGCLSQAQIAGGVMSYHINIRIRWGKETCKGTLAQGTLSTRKTIFSPFFWRRESGIGVDESQGNGTDSEHYQKR